MGKLSEKFGMPPFSVFDARSGSWQRRKRWWISLGIESELGRGENSESICVFDWCIDHVPNVAIHKSKVTISNSVGKRLTFVTRDVPYDQLDDVSQRILRPGTKNGSQHGPGTSIFDPVLCELLYKWFVPINGSILDPFAGGSVRGIVANYLCYQYTGIDLRPEQISENNAQANRILLEKNKPIWIVGDSKNLDSITEDTYDFIFSCPPYYNLEKYSNDENDLSNCESYESFIDDYKNIIQLSINKLRNDRFACFVVGDIRDANGYYYGFVKDTIDAFQAAGMNLYNDAILVTAVGSLSIRVERQFRGYRKLGKTHQNVLIFYKGNPKKIPENFTMPDSIMHREEDLFSFT